LFRGGPYCNALFFLRCGKGKPASVFAAFTFFLAFEILIYYAFALAVKWFASLKTLGAKTVSVTK
jgi:hypothetical protein